MRPTAVLAPLLRAILTMWTMVVVVEHQRNHAMLRTSKSDTNISFYPKRWRGLLDLAKARMRLHAAVEDAFPRLEVAIDGRCSEVLHEVIAYYKTQNWELEKGIYPEHRVGMCRLIFNDTQTFRSDLKKEVAKNLRVDYDIFPSKNAKTAEERTMQIKSKAVELLSSAAYLRGDVDANGKSSNFAHRGLQRPCLAFFYSNSKKALRQFTEFQPHVPYKTLTLVGAIVYGLLDGLREYGDDQLAFENTSWSVIQSAQQQLNESLTNLLGNDYHGSKLNAMLEDWAQTGMYV
ncbi:hypothetical protein EV363DRAFT_1411559 [Boletus edulis]|nr:hypothetical protein EV363DRAFT_1411559 [Boletus edulis]